MSDPSHTPDSSASVSQFCTEARELLEPVGSWLLQLEDRPDDHGLLDSVFGVFRALKLQAEPLGLERLARPLTLGERTLYACHTRGLAVTPALAEALLELTDLLVRQLEDPARESPGTDDQKLDALAERIPRLLREAPLLPPRAAPTPGVASPPPGTGLAAELVSQFVIESADSLQELESALLELEQHPSDLDTLNRIFRAVHSIKGTADYVGLNQIKTLSHRLENVLGHARAARLDLTPAVSDLIFRAVDELKALITTLLPDAEQPRELGDILQALDRINPTKEVPQETPAAGAAAQVPQEMEVFHQAAGQHLESITDCLRAIADGNTSDALLAVLRRSASSLHTAADFMSRDDYSNPAFDLVSLVDEFRARREQFVDQLRCLLQPELRAASPEPEAPAAVAPPGAKPPAPPGGPAAPAPEVARAGSGPEGQKGAAGNKPGSARTMRVDQHKLDEYVNLAGELVIARNALTHVFRQFQTNRGNMRHLKDAVEKVHRIVADIQSNAMAMRMVPVSTVFQRFPRMIRDVAKSLNKQIELHLSGEETEIDKQVAEALADPLVHLIRNAADHGIETPEVRRAEGKPETGSITLRAGRDGNVITLDIIDDGAGINADRLKAKAVEHGLMTAEQADAMPREKALELIFAPGLSTARTVSDLSGRGVGMDVVRSNLAALGGSVVIQSEPGQGTTIRLQLPLTLAVTKMILVSAGGWTYALPLESVRETVKVTPSTLKKLNGRDAIPFRGDVIAVSSLGSLLGLKGGAAPAPEHGSSRLPIVILTVGDAQFGVLVDELHGQQELVIKALPPSLAELPGMGGATVLGDGTVVLILDPRSLYEQAVEAGRAAATVACCA